MNNVESHISIQYFQHAYAEFILGSYNNALCLCDFRYRKLRQLLMIEFKSAQCHVH